MISLLLLLVFLVSITVTYAILSQPSTEDEISPDSSEIIDDDTFTNEIDATFLDEDQGIEIGEMI